MAWKEEEEEQQQQQKEEGGGGGEEEDDFGRLVTFWFGTFAMLFSTTGCVVHHENTGR